jgi:hypothetical protein
MSITFTAVHPGCTITTSATERCGKPSIASFVSGSGRTYHECAEHAVGAAPAPVAKQPAPHPPTRTTRPFVLVRHGKIVGYAESRANAQSRAARLGAEVVAVQR